MSRIVTWLLHHEHRLFRWINQRLRHQALDWFFNTVTHLGGASATIAITLGLAVLARGEWRTTAIQSLIALAVSHLPVAVIKKKYPRLRPYLVLPHTITGKNPLKDHSFPSGHTTAVFSVTVPFMLNMSPAFLFLLPLACLVGMSRIYLGLHYPSDCLAGSLIGTVTAFAAVAFFG